MALRRVPDRDRGRIIDRLTMTLGIRWLNEIQGDQLSDGAFAMLLQPLIDDPKLRSRLKGATNGRRGPERGTIPAAHRSRASWAFLWARDHRGRRARRRMGGGPLDSRRVGCILIDAASGSTVPRAGVPSAVLT